MPRSTYLPILNHDVHVTEWGAPEAPPVILWHGLSRNGRDFDDIARHLSSHFFVLCPDTIGRGLSSWSTDPYNDYMVGTYVAHALLIMDAYGLEQVDWVGTSMGGIIGMAIASSPLRHHIKRLVLNDIGGEIHAPALNRIRDYVTQSPDFATLSEFEEYVRLIHSSFGPHTDAQWRRMAENSYRRMDNGRITNHFDPKVMEVFANAFVDNNPMLWDMYDNVTCPTLLLRGERSELLQVQVAEAMSVRGPCARTINIPECGHAPGLNTEWQIQIVEQYLMSAYECSL